MEELAYPFDSKQILKKKKAIKRQLLADESGRIKKRIAILGGSTTAEIKNILEIFLLNYGIDPCFYECEYGQYWQEVMFGSELYEFSPDICFVHTTSRNISTWPSLSNSKDQIDAMVESQFSHFMPMWEKITRELKCPIIQNNFERPLFRLLGNKDISDYHGRTNYIFRLNQKLYEYAQNNDGFFINDIDYLSAFYGLGKWSDPFYWHMYKYALAMPAIPDFAFNVANIIKAIYGKNKKALAIDLDNTLWGGVVGDDGVCGISVGQETSVGQAYSEFQSYLKELKQLGIILNIISKNEYENAISGLNHPDGLLTPDDFVAIKANWEPKSGNLYTIANELALLPESFVFLDDNPAEQEIIRQQIPGVSVPKMKQVEYYITEVDRAGYFEATVISEDDTKRAEMYKENAQRAQTQATFVNYHDYLLSLEMKAIIEKFEPLYMARIAQLTNKSNQFNLTTKRYTQEEIESCAADENTITLYGKLSDKFGDNGVVSVVIGHIDNESLHIDLWIMSCRVLKRDMEFAMMDKLVKMCKRHGIKTIIGYYYPTTKNRMVKEFYAGQGFTKLSENEFGNAVWYFEISEDYKNKQDVINVN